MEFLTAGDSTLVVRFGNEISEEINQKVRTFRLAIEKHRVRGLIELVPTYCTVYVFYDPLVISSKELIEQLKSIAEEMTEEVLPEPNIVEVPVAYGGENGPDIEYVAKYHDLTVEEVIKRHSEKNYLVYMLGFTPGFTFCGGLGDDLATPRKKDPRLKVPTGSVGIAGKQTGIYAISSPGGWQLIGRTTMRFYNPDTDPPCPVKAGDYVRFIPVSAEEFEKHRNEVEAADNPPDYSNWEAGGTPVFNVITPGFLSSIQDKGRVGYQELGISGSGAMDEIAFRIANRIVGNDDNTPALEITMIGPQLEATKTTLISVTGGDLSFAVNGKLAPQYTAIQLNPGDKVSFGALKKGLRAYIAINSGFSVPLVMGSASTGLKGQIGGYKGRKLEKGDILNSTAETIPQTFIGYSVNPEDFNFESKEGVYRVILGPEDDHFTEKGIKTFLNSEYKLSENCDRMGARLDGPLIEHNEKGAGIVSDGITMGAIQVPAEGYPIVLLKDRGTVGGYTKIGTLCTIDVFRFGQKKPGDVVRFEQITTEEAQKLLRQMEYKISKIGLRQRIQALTGSKDGDLLRIVVGNNFYDVFVEDI